MEKTSYQNICHWSTQHSGNAYRYYNRQPGRYALEIIKRNKSLTAEATGGSAKIAASYFLTDCSATTPWSCCKWYFFSRWMYKQQILNVYLSISQWTKLIAGNLSPYLNELLSFFCPSSAAYICHWIYHWGLNFCSSKFMGCLKATPTYTYGKGTSINYRQEPSASIHNELEHILSRGEAARQRLPKREAVFVL